MFKHKSKTKGCEGFIKARQRLESKVDYKGKVGY